MGEETYKLDTLYMVDEEGNRKELGKITQIECTYASEWNKRYKEKDYMENTSGMENTSDSIELTIDDKRISKKRFIKLLMGNFKIQRNEAIKMHNEFMKEHRKRTEIGFTFFMMIYSTNTLGNSIADFGRKADEVADKIIEIK